MEARRSGRWTTIVALSAMTTTCITNTATAHPAAASSPAPAATISPGVMMTPDVTMSPRAMVTPAALVSPSAMMTQTPAAVDFGSPPSGEIPILFNDHHVYAKPDDLTHGRVLSAIVRGNVVLVPMRSMFEQMGAVVTFDPSTKMVDVAKPGSDVKVEVGKPVVIANGETRPLDVAPEIYRGVLVVPLRVLSEGMGAYVQWVPEQRTVVVRYLIAAIPTPAPLETTAPGGAGATRATPGPIPTLAPEKKRSSYERFVVGDYVFTPQVYNELSPGNHGYDSVRVNGAVEFKLADLPWMIEGDYRQFRYAHNQTKTASLQSGCPNPGEQGCVTEIGPPGSAQVFVPYFSARDSDFEGRFGFKIADPRIYVGIGFVFRSNNYSYPIQRGVGFGISKLPDLDARFSVYGSAYFFPQISGDFIDPGSGVMEKLQYRLLKYDVGLTFHLFKSPFFVDAGYYGDKLFDKQNAPSDVTENGFYAGLGLNF